MRPTVTPVAERQSLGRWGESYAAEHLESLGYHVIARNWRCRSGEIDLVAQDRDEVVIVEVKARRGTGHGLPEEALTPRKAAQLLSLGEQYVGQHCAPDTAWRIDLIAIELDANGRLVRCDHVPHAVLGW
jgi:putative endonuclease